MFLSVNLFFILLLLISPALLRGRNLVNLVNLSAFSLYLIYFSGAQHPFGGRGDVVSVVFVVVSFFPPSGGI